MFKLFGNDENYLQNNEGTPPPDVAPIPPYASGNANGESSSSQPVMVDQGISQPATQPAPAESQASSNLSQQMPGSSGESNASSQQGELNNSTDSSQTPPSSTFWSEGQGDTQSATDPSVAPEAESDKPLNPPDAIINNGNIVDQNPDTLSAQDSNEQPAGQTSSFDPTVSVEKPATVNEPSASVTQGEKEKPEEPENLRSQLESLQEELSLVSSKLTAIISNLPLGNGASDSSTLPEAAKESEVGNDNIINFPTQPPAQET